MSDGFDFEVIYKMYPRKVGKARGIRQCQLQIKTIEDYELLSLAVQRYAKIVSGTDKQYIKHFATFMGTGASPTWRDYLEEDAGEARSSYKGIDAILKELGEE